MGPQPAPVPKVSFGPFEYDDFSGSLSKYGTPIRLNGKPLQILSVLVNRPGQVVSREELQRHLWDGATFVDFEQGLNSAVNKLRQTLGDSADRPRYVETVPGRGYRFIAPIQRAAASAVVEMPAAVPSPLRIEPKPAKPPRRWLAIAAGLAVVVLAGGGAWRAKRPFAPTGREKAVRFSIPAPAGFAFEGAASRQSFALSPDGSRLAFTAMDSSGDFSVFLRDFSAAESRLIPGTAGSHTVFWPPDGRSLYLTSKGKFWRAQLEGDARALLSDSPPFMFSGAPLRPDRILLDSFRGSYVVPTSGGPLEPLDNINSWPHPLPGGEHVLTVKWDAGAGRFRLRALRTSDLGLVKELIETDSRVQYVASVDTPGMGYLMYVRAGNLLAHPFDPASLRVTGDPMPIASKVCYFFQTGAADFSVSDQGTLAYQTYVSRSQLEWVDRTGRRLGTIGPANTNLKSARLSPDGQWVATSIFDIERGQEELWVFHTKTNLGRLLTPDHALRDGAVWSPDSKKLAFLHTADASPPNVHMRGLGENDVEVAMPATDFQYSTDWSPDGRFLTFMNTGFPRLQSEQQSDVMLFDLARGRKVIPLLNTPYHEANGVFSPDGRWLAFSSNQSGRTEVYLQSFRGGDTPGLFGERHRVSAAEAGAFPVRWRRDGKELFFLDNAGRVQAVPVRLGPKPEFGPATALFTITTEARAAIHSVIGFDVSSDGSRFVVPAVNSPESPSLVVIQHWESLLPPKP